MTRLFAWTYVVCLLGALVVALLLTRELGQAIQSGKDRVDYVEGVLNKHIYQKDDPTCANGGCSELVPLNGVPDKPMSALPAPVRALPELDTRPCSGGATHWVPSLVKPGEVIPAYPSNPICAPPTKPR